MKTAALIPLLFAASLSAQSYVSPASHTHSEAAGTQSFPFGIATVPFRYLQIHDDVPSPMVIHGLAFRHNAAGGNNTIYPAHSITLDAWVSTATTASATASSTYNTNHGTDKTQVITNRTYNLPASDPTDLPGEFVLDFPFDLPFVYLGGAALCWEVQITAKTQTSTIFYDANLAANANPPFQVNRGGAGCLSTGATAAMDVNALGPMDWTTGNGTLNTTGSRLLSNGLVILVRGLDKTSYQSQPLPAVIPTSTGAPSGTCLLYQDIFTSEVGVASSAGSYTFATSFSLPPATLALMNGLKVYAQILGFDPQANPLGVTSSKLAIYNIVAPYPAAPVARVYRSGDLVNPVGTMQTTNTLVTKFY